MATKRQLLINGYIRNLQFLIPKEINLLVLMFYGRPYIAYAIGRNSFGEMSLDHFHKVTKKWAKLKDFAMRVHSLHDIYCGHGRFIIKNEYHKIYSVGKNDRGELGLSMDKVRVTKTKRLKQVGMSSYDHINDPVVLISNGKMSKHTFLKTSNNQIFGFGNNHYCQLGNGDKTYDKIMTPLQLYEVEDIFQDINIVHIECGMLHTLFLTANGEVYSCGFNGI